MSDETRIDQPAPPASENVRFERDVVITRSLLSRAKETDWTTKRAIIVGALVGAFLGAVFFAGYAGTSAWICSSRLDCGHWAPITIVAVSGAIAFTIIGAAAGFVLNKVYRAFRIV